MDLSDLTNRRKSYRNYTQQPFEEKRLEEIHKAINGFELFCPDVPLEYRFITRAKGIFKVQVLYYLVISEQGREKESKNTGFLSQQLILWSDARDTGSAWFGKIKDMEDVNNRGIITTALGQADGSAHRSKDELKRKPINEVTNAPENTYIQAVHLTPSGMSIQPRYLEESSGRVLLYKQSLKPSPSLIYKKTETGMGIALCHYALACRHSDKLFAFHRKEEEADKKGYRLPGELA